MHIIGLICEYNPFHNGHIYHIKKIKELYPHSLLILVLNGYFLERGEISILSKEDKTNIALTYGIDLILELPFIFGTQAADIFADTAIKILNQFHVEKLIFGSESNNIEQITSIAKKQLNDTSYHQQVKVYLKEGLNYPTALAKALNQQEFSFLPNDLLGISYMKSILKNNFSMEGMTIKRTNDYKDTISNEDIVSASNIREKIKRNEDIKKYLPLVSYKNINSIDEAFLFKLLRYKIITDPDLSLYLDVDEGIENRLKEKISISTSLKDYIENIKTKRYTYNKINRMLIHILIGLKKSDAHPPIDYIRILGFNQKGQEYLNKIKDTLTISTIINKNSIIYQYEIVASILYDMLMHTNTLLFEQKKQPIIFD